MNDRNYRSLAEALDAQYLTDDLKKLAALICPVVPAKKIDRIESIVSILLKDPNAIFRRLSPLAQHAVEETVHTWDGIFDSQMFYAKYSAHPWAGAKEGNRRSEGGDPLLLFLLGGRIPDDLLKLLREVVPQPPEDEIRYAATDPEQSVIRETARPALANTTILLQLAAEKKIRVGAKTGRGTAATVAMIGELLSEGDWYNDAEIGPMQAFAWPLLLQGGGLAKLDGSILALTPAGVKARKSKPAERVKAIWNKWEKNTIIDEFSRVEAIKGQKSNSGRTMTSPAKRRPMINDLLRELQPGKWLAVEELSRLAQADGSYSFAMVNYDWKLYFADPQYGHIDNDDTWQLLQFRYLLVYLFEYCATLGLLDVAYSDPQWLRDDFRSFWGTDELEFLCHCDGLQYIRINDLGAYILGHTDTFTAESAAEASYAFDGQDILYIGGDEIQPGQVFALDRMAKRLESNRWRLSAASLLDAIDGGESLVEIQTRLSEASATPLNAELEQLFREVGQRSTAFVEVGRTTLIECSPQLRNQVLTLTNKNISHLCIPAGDRYLVVVPGKEKLFAAAIASLGYRITLAPQQP